MDHRAAEDRRDAAAGCSLRQSDPAGASATCGERAAPNAAGKAPAAEALHKRLLARQSCLQILGNTNRLLRQRGHLAEAALQQARARNAACVPAAEPPPPLDCGLVSPEAGRLTACAQRRMFTPSADSPAPGLARFRAHCGINTDALIRMQGSTGSIDVSEKNLRVLIDDYRSRTAVSASMHEDQICWHLVTTWEMAPGMPLSFGLALTTAACTASFLVTFFLCQVECALLLEENSMIDISHSPIVAEEAPGKQPPLCEVATGGQGSGGDVQQPLHQPCATCSHPDPCACPRPPPPRPLTVATDDGRNLHGGYSADGAHGPGPSEPADVHESSARPSSARALSAAPALRARDRNGLDLATGTVRAPSAAIYEGSGESVGSRGRGSSSDDELGGMWRDGCVGEAATTMEPQLRCGVGDSLPLGPTALTAMEALVRRFTHRLPQRCVLNVLDVMLRSFEQSSSSGGDGQGAEGPASDDDALGAGEALHDHHWQGIITATMAAQEALTVARERLRQEEEQPWSVAPSEHARDMQRQAKRAQDFTLGLVALKAFCSRVMLSLALKFAFPGTPEFCKVENMQVRLYKILRLPQSQKALMAAVWKDWERNRSMLSLSLTEAQLPMSVWSPHATDMPPTLAALAAAVAVGGSTFRLRKLPERSHVPDARSVGYFSQVMHGHGGADTVRSLPKRRFCAADGRLLLDSPAAWVSSRELAAAAPGMLGQCPVATIAAAETLRRLRAMHGMSLRLYLDVQSRVVPGDMLTGPQVMQMFWMPVQHGLGCTDLLALCHIAHRQLARESTFAMVEAIGL